MIGKDDDRNLRATTIYHKKDYVPPAGLKLRDNGLPDAFELDPFLTPGGAALDAVVAMFGRRAWPHMNKQRRSMEYDANLRILVANLIVGHKRQPGKPFKFYRTPKAYSGHSVYRPDVLSAKVLGPLVDALTAAGLVDNDLGWASPNGADAMMSLVWTTDKSQRIFGLFGLTRRMVTERPDKPAIILKSPKNRYRYRHKVEYDPHKVGQAESRNLGLVNALLSQAKLGWDLPRERWADFQPKRPLKPWEDDEHPTWFDLADVRLHRVFNDVDAKAIRLEFGGRWYGGWWQRIKKGGRRFITIDGQPTVELDFSALHPRMLYHKLKAQTGGDPYTIPAIVAEAGNFDPDKLRATTKTLFSVLLNATTRQIKVALGAPRDELLKNWDIELPDHMAIDHVLELIESEHGAIAHHFGKGIGRKLQKLDSDVCEHVLLGGRSRNRVILPVHDSFICKAEDEWLVRELMIRAYQSVVGPYVPEIKLK